MGRGNDGIQMTGMTSAGLPRFFEMASLTYKIRDGLQGGWPDHDLFDN